MDDSVVERILKNLFFEFNTYEENKIVYTRKVWELGDIVDGMMIGNRTEGGSIRVINDIKTMHSPDVVWVMSSQAHYVNPTVQSDENGKIKTTHAVAPETGFRFGDLELKRGIYRIAVDVYKGD